MQSTLKVVYRYTAYSQVTYALHFQYISHDMTNKRSRKPRGQSRMDNAETQTFLGTQDTDRR